MRKKRDTLVGHLPDIGHDAVDAIFGSAFDRSIYSGSNDIILFLILAATVLFIGICHVGQRLRIYKRWMVVMIIIYALNSFLHFTTSFPHPKDYVLEHSCKRWDNVFLAPIYMGFEGRKSCYDSFFSGHASNCAVAASLWTSLWKPTSHFLIHTTKPPSNLRYLWLCLPAAMWFLVVWEVIFILVLQVHYSIDVDVGFIFGVVFWYIAQLQTSTRAKGFFTWWEPTDSIYNPDLETEETAERTELQENADGTQKKEEAGNE
jgi:membrane-associated phospholipid phosphatase